VRGKALGHSSTTAGASNRSSRVVRLRQGRRTIAALDR